MSVRKLFAAAAIAAGLFGLGGFSGSADAAVFVGSWEVDQGPQWYQPPNGPLAYTGQEAAALLFGGTPSDYAISTVDANPLNIDFNAWYSIIGYGADMFAQNYSSKYLGLYYGPSEGYSYVYDGPASAYVSDNAIGSQFTNYAFRLDNLRADSVPEPASLALFGLGLMGLAVVRRKR